MRTSKFILIVSFLMISIFVFSAVRDIDTINETGIFKSPELISEVFPNLIKLIDIKNNVGQLKNHYFLNQSEVIVSDFCFYDINGDDSDDILFYTRDKQGSLKINAVEFNCKGIFGFPKVLPSNISGVTGKPEIGDLNNDGEYEFIIFTDNGSYNIYDNDMNLLQENIISTKPVYGLINEEGADNQIIVTTVNNLGKTILVINNFLTNISIFEIDNFNAPNTILYKDIDNDGEKEIILGDGENCKAFTFSNSGLVLKGETTFPTNFIFTKLNIIKINNKNNYIGISKDNKVNAIDIFGKLLFSGDILKIFGLTYFSIYNFPETSPENDELIFAYRDLMAYYNFDDSFDDGFEYNELSRFNNKLYNNFEDIDLEIISPNFPIIETESGFDIDITIDVVNPGNKQMYYKTFIYQENDKMVSLEPTNKAIGSQYLGEIFGNKSDYKISTFNTAFIEDLYGTCDIRVKVVDTEGRTANVDKEILKTKIDENYVLNNLSTVPSFSYSNEINLFGTRSENILQLFFLYKGQCKKINKDIKLTNKMIFNDLYDFETEFNEVNKQISICYVVKNNNLKELRFKRILFFPIESELEQMIYTTENSIKEIKMKKFNNEILIVLKLLDSSDNRFKLITLYSNNNGNSFTSKVLPLNFSALAFMNFELDSIGNIHLIWREQSGFYFDIYYSKYSKTLGEIIPPEKINTGTDIYINNPNIQICEDDSVHILYSALDENKGSGGPNDPLNMKLMYSYRVNNSFVEPLKILNFYNLRTSLGNDIDNFSIEKDSQDFIYMFISLESWIPFMNEVISYKIITNRSGLFTFSDLLVTTNNFKFNSPVGFISDNYIEIFYESNGSIIKRKLDISNYSLQEETIFSDYETNIISQKPIIKRQGYKYFGIWGNITNNGIYYSDNFTWHYSFELEKCENYYLIYGTGKDISLTSIPLEFSTLYASKTDLISPVDDDILQRENKTSNNLETFKHLVSSNTSSEDTEIFIEYKRSWDSDWSIGTKNIPIQLNTTEEWYWDTVDVPDGRFDLRLNSSFTGFSCTDFNPDSISIFLDNFKLEIIDPEMSNLIIVPQYGTIISYKLSEPATVTITVFERFNPKHLFQTTSFQNGNDKTQESNLLNPNVENFYWDCRDPDGNIIPDGSYQMTILAENEIGERAMVIMNFNVNSTMPPINLPTVFNSSIFPNPYNILCGGESNLSISYQIDGSGDEYLTFIYVVDFDNNIIKKVTDGIIQGKGEHLEIWDGTVDSQWDTDGNGLVDQGNYQIQIFVIENKSNGRISNNVFLELNVPVDYEDKYWYRDPGIRIDIGGYYERSPGSLSPVCAAVAPSIIELPEGSYRMYYDTGGCPNGWWRRIASATSADGINWTKEGVVKFIGSQPYGPDWMNPCVIQLDDGRYRLFFDVWKKICTLSGCVYYEWIISAISSDGRNFTLESGVRLKYGGPNDGTGALMPSIVKMQDGTWKMYYYGRNYPSPKQILSATSMDGYNFIKDEGIRIPASWGFETGVMSPDAVINEEGEITLVYSTYIPGTNQLKIFHIAKSNDGINFTRTEDVYLSGWTDVYESFLAYYGCLFSFGDSMKLYYTGRKDSVFQRQMRILSATRSETISMPISIPLMSKMNLPDDDFNSEIKTSDELLSGSTYYHVDIELTEMEDRSFLKLKDGETYSGEVDVLCEAKEGDGIVRVEIYVNNLKKSEKADYKLNYKWNTKDFENGDYLIKAIAFDKRNNYGVKTKVVRLFNQLGSQGGGDDDEDDDDDDSESEEDDDTDDNRAPVTHIRVDPSRISNGMLQVIKHSTLKFKVESQDNTGIKVTRYNPDKVGWFNYLNEFELTDWSIGVHQLKYYSVDANDNKENVKKSSIEIVEPFNFDIDIQASTSTLIWINKHSLNNDKKKLIEKLFSEVSFDNYKIVYSKSEFKNELLSSGYNSFIILGNHSYLDKFTSDLLKEEIRNGASIFNSVYYRTDGITNNSSIFGIDFIGYSPPGSYSILIENNDILGELNLTFNKKFTKVDLIKTEAKGYGWIELNNKQYPILVISTFGNAKNIYFSFDFIEYLSEETYSDVKRIFNNFIISSSFTESSNIKILTVNINDIFNNINIMLRVSIPDGIDILSVLGEDEIINQSITKLIKDNSGGITLILKVPIVPYTLNLKIKIGIKVDGYFKFETLDDIILNSPVNMEIFKSELINGLNNWILEGENEVYKYQVIEKIEGIDLFPEDNEAVLRNIEFTLEAIELISKINDIKKDDFRKDIFKIIQYLKEKIDSGE